jgi:uncharacterized SAM-binding protein YcdF (DUF218 family)
MTRLTIDQDAKTIWDYLQLEQEPQPSDAIFVLGGIDTRVAERAAELFGAGYGKYIVVSGGVGRLTKAVFTEPEARVFSKIMIAQGIPANKVIIEDKSANTGENIQFTYELLRRLGLHFDSLLLVQKPYMERRAYATFKKQWPDPDIEITVTSPDIDYEDYCNESCPKELVLNDMVANLQRIKEYPSLGFQIEQHMPDEVWAAYERLVAAGYDEQLR